MTIEKLLMLSYEEMIDIPIHSNPVKKILVQKYSDMRQRCENPKNRLFKWYGAKGIYCNIPKNIFYKWCFEEMKNYYKIHKSLHRCSVGRIDHGKSYVIGNVELLSSKDNSKEQTTRLPNPNPLSNKLDDCIVLMALTVSTSSMELADIYKVSNTAFNRIRNGSNWNWIYRKVVL